MSSTPVPESEDLERGKSVAVGPKDGSSQPPHVFAAYRSSRLRGPTQSSIPIARTLSELTGPVNGHDRPHSIDADLTRNARQSGEPIGERIVVAGRIVQEGGLPLSGALVEIWQANAAGRYAQSNDQHDAPLDPNFLGAGRCVSDANGHYSFRTIKPGAYPWRNHANAWRPNHIHLSLFGPTLGSRLVTQMYFSGDPLLAHDPIFNSVPEGARGRLVSELDLDLTVPEFALAYRFDVVLRGEQATPVEP